MIELVNHTKKLLLLCLYALPLSAAAELRPVDDAELEDVSGQALVDVVELYDPSQGFRFMRVRTGSRVEINANIDELRLGTYYRNDSFVSQFCTTETPDGKCPDIGSRTVQVGDYVNHPGATGSAPGASGNRKTTSGALQAGFTGQYTTQGTDGNYYVDVPTSDVMIDNLSLGSVVNGKLQPMILENTYFEFVFDDANGGSLVGLRLGAESQSGNLGNASSGGACNFGTKCGGALSFSGNLNLDVGLAKSIMFEAGRSNFSPALAGLDLIALIAGTSPGQTLGDINHRDTREFFVSLATKPITYPTISGDPARQQVQDLTKTVRTPRAIPGFSLNITDGITANAGQALTGIPKRSNCFGGSLGSC